MILNPPCNNWILVLLCTCGYYYDEESGLYYLQSRYYDPTTGRFLNADAFASTGQGILGHNAFVYCLNNPINRIDMIGTISIWYYLIVDSDMGFVHRLVQAHIIASYGASFTSEMTLDGHGRADIVDANNGLVWEVKHAGQQPELRALIAIMQATKYIGGTSGKTTIIGLGAANTFEGTFYIQCMDSYYEVRYSTPAAGAILYSVQEIQNYTGEVVAVYVPKEQRENNRGVQAVGMIGVFIGGGGGFRSVEDIARDMAYTY